MKFQYFLQDVADPDDWLLDQAKRDEQVPTNCLLGGQIVKALVDQKKDPCLTCNGPRNKCGGRDRLTLEEISRQDTIDQVESLLKVEDPEAIAAMAKWLKH